MAAIQAYRDPTILLDQEYQAALHDSFLTLIASFYLVFLTVFFIPALESIYNSYGGYKDNFKELDELKITGKKQLKQYHIDLADRDHMREETKQMLLSDNLDFMIGVIIIIIFILVIRKKAK